MSVGEDGRSVLDTGKVDRSVWLMKCPPVVSRTWQYSATTAADAGVAPPVVSKVVLSLDPLLSDQPVQFKMELARTESGNTPKSYSLNMFKDFVPMCVFSESIQGKVSLEGKVEHKFDMEPHSENIGEYGKLCRERTTKAMIKTRQVQVIDNDNGGLMRPMPGMLGFAASGSKQFLKEILLTTSVYTTSGGQTKEPMSLSPNTGNRTRSWMLLRTQICGFNFNF